LMTFDVNLQYETTCFSSDLCGRFDPDPAADIPLSGPIHSLITPLLIKK
jgi:hypothetical protein